MRSTKANFERVSKIPDEQERLAKLKTFEFEPTGLNYWYHRAQEEIQKIEGTYQIKAFYLHDPPNT